MSEQTKKAVVLLSGGLDSSTVLAIAREQKYACYCLTVRYGQLHQCEIDAATRIAADFSAQEHRTLELDLAPLAKSALTSNEIEVPKDRKLDEIGAENDVPSTYVPARNTVLLSLALAWAETLEANDIFVGVNVLDASGYPDCRPEFVDAFERLAQVATRSGTQGQQIRIHAPLIELDKAGIVKKGTSLGVDYSRTHSCYSPDQQGLACSRCDACQLRKKGFNEAGIPDPTRYSVT